MWRLSDMLLRYDEHVRKEIYADSTTEERRQMDAAERIAALLVPKLVDARLKLKVRDRSALKMLDTLQGDFLERSFDTHWSRALLQQVPRFARRTARLASLCAEITPHSHVNVYLEDATRSYIFGLWQASVASARAAVEVAVADSIGNKVGSVPERAMLSELLALATRVRGSRTRILDQAHAEKAWSVLRVGNGVLHREPIDSRTALDTLQKAREILVYLYQGKTRTLDATR